MPPSDPALRSATADRSPSPRRATGLVIAVVLLAGGLASAVAWRIAENGADDQEAATADSVVETLQQSADDLVVVMSGTSAIVGVDGTVSQDSLDRFADDVASVGTARPVAWLVPLPRADGQEDWSVNLTAIGALPDDDGTSPGAVGPLAPGAQLTAGTELADAAATAQETARPVITRVELTDGTARLAVLKPVFRILEADRTTPQFAGVVASVDPSEVLARRIASEEPGDVRFTISDGDAVLAASSPPPSSGVVRTVEVDGRPLTVQVEDDRPVSHDLSWFLLWITAVIVMAAGVLGLRSARYDEERRRTNAMIGGTADLAQHFASAATAGDVAEVISTYLPPLFDAEIASFGEVDDDRGVVHLHHGPDVDPEVSARITELDLDDIPTIAAAVSSGSTVLLRDEQDWRAAMSPDLADDLLRSGARAAAVLPLAAADQGVMATVSIIWWRPPQFDERTLGTLETVRELCEQSLGRAALTDRISERASHLADLAERLAGVDTVADTAHTVTTMSLGAVGASAASVGVRDDDLHVLRVHHGDTVEGRALQVFAELPIDAPLAFTEAARTGVPILCCDMDDYDARFPNTDDANLDLGRGGRAAFPLRADEDVIGSIVFAWDHRVTFAEDLVNELTTVAEITAQSVRRAQLIEDQAADARRSRALSELAQGLAGRADAADIAGFLTESVLAPLDAIHSVVGVIDGSELIRRYSKGLVETGLTAMGETFARSELTTRTPATDAVRDGTLVFVGNRAEGLERFGDLSAVWEALGVHAAAAVPVRDRSGRVVASITAMWDRPMVPRGDLIDTLSTVAGMVGQTLERTGLVDELRRSAVRSEAMADFAQHLASVQSTDELCVAVIDRAASTVGAAVADFGLFDGQSTLQRPDSAPVPELLPASVAPVGANASHPAVQCLVERVPVLVQGEDQIRERYTPEVAAALLDAGLHATAHMPLAGQGGQEIGALAVAWSSTQEQSPTVRAKLRTLAELCGQTFERARLSEAEHRLVVSLQDRVVRPVPAAAGLRIAERYLPASEQVGMGGDWFDGIALDDHRFAVVVGDIAGHGINAVADMVELRAIIGSLLRSSTPLEEVYPQVAALLQQGGSGLTATSCTAVFDTRADSVRYVSAGHLPPVLARPDGTVELLVHGRQPLLGVPSTAVSPGSTSFAPGSVLALYTDGIVERRREPIDESLARIESAMRDLRSVAPGASGPVDGNGSLRVVSGAGVGSEVGVVSEVDVEGLADDLLERCLGDRPTDDDVALVVIARVDS